MTNDKRTDAHPGVESEADMARRLANLTGQDLVREIVGILHRMDARYMVLLRRLFVVCAILAVFLMGSLAASLVAVKQTQDSQNDAINANKRGIFVSCTLLANAIIESGGASGADATQLFVTAIQRVMTPEEKAKFKKAFAQPQNLTVPPCKKISENPASVHASPSSKKKTPPKKKTP